MRDLKIRKLTVFAFVLLVPGCYTKCLPATRTATPPRGGEGKVIEVRLPALESLGSISGKVRFEGTPPNRASIEMADPACACQHIDPPAMEETVEVGADGALKNVMVWVSKGLDPALAWPVPAAPARLTQAGCVFAPHVLSMRAMQPLEVGNGDGISHNFHARPKKNDEDNFSQGARQVDLLTTTSKHKTFLSPEDPFRCGCDIHGWMGVWVGVFRHPFHAVTAEDGQFRLEGVPEGKVTLRFWHEKLGTRDVEVEVKRGVDVPVEAEFSAK